jgi:SAM-dependent methyltransferase
MHQNETDLSLFGRIREEIEHWRRRHWTFEDVGRHWDATEDYDEINEGTYSYFRRFIDGLRLSDLKPNSHVLDFCARTGNGTAYFFENGKVGSAVCADVSDRMGQICVQRLRQSGMQDFVWERILDYSFPFEDESFDAVLCFETVEHFPDPNRLIQELGRITRPGGSLILTTPNVLWEPIHALAAITKFHHSEGPHRFIRFGKLKSMVEDAGFAIEQAVTTVLIPGGPEWLTRIGELIEERTVNWLMPIFGLRRIVIGRKRK